MGYCFSLLYLFTFIAAGIFIVRCLLPRVGAVARVWLGVSLGILLQMWLPLLAAFVFRFSMPAHAVALAPLALFCAAAFFLRSRVRPAPFGNEDKKLLLSLLCVALPLTLVGGYLQWTHNIMPDAMGNLHVGQSTYGDLNLHLGIITSLRDASIPADYSIFPGEKLCYPFLTDSFSTTFMLFGCSLRFSVVFPGILLMALTFSGYLILAQHISGKRRVAVLAALLFFINGGLGFLYSFDMLGVSQGIPGDHELQSGTGLLSRLDTILHGWYQTPANHAEFTSYNLRWSNVIADMLIPQRTILGGWCLLLPCLYLLWDLAAGDRFDPLPLSPISDDLPAVPSGRKDLRLAVLLGIWAGLLPMVHTHSFLALGLISLGWMVWDCVANRRHFSRVFPGWLLYGGIAVALAAPQLFLWTFSQVSGGQGFLTFQFNWVNNSGGNGLRDGYFWFYIKNIGLPFILLIIALFEKNKKTRFIACGAFVVFLAAEFIRFQPNEYDNNKLFYVWYMLCAVIAADYACRLFTALRAFRGRWVMAVLVCFGFFCTGTLSIARECVSDYQTFSSADAAAAAYIEENTPKDSVFLTWTEHINPVSALTGRTIVCGPSLWLHWHGFNIYGREARISNFYQDPESELSLLRDYGVDYIYAGPYENYECRADREALDALFERVYTSPMGDICIWAVPEEMSAP